MHGCCPHKLRQVAWVLLLGSGSSSGSSSHSGNSGKLLYLSLHLFPHWLNEDSNTCPAYSPGLLRIRGNSSVKAVLADSCYLVNVPRSAGYTTKQPFCLLEMLLTEELEYMGTPLWQSPCPFPQLTESQSHGPTMPIQCQMNHSIGLPLLSADITNRLRHFLLSLNGRGLRFLLNTTL